jgi:simple sugar transport system permease protein
VSTIITWAFISSVLQATLTLATPLILGALGGVISERSGVVNIAIEGMMLIGAFVCASVGYSTGSLQLGLLLGTFAGMVTGFMLAVLAVSLRIDQVVAGFVINIAAAGGTSYVFRSTIGGSGSASVPLLNQYNVPGLSNLPAIGTILFQQNPLVYLTLLLVPVVHVYLFKTRSGLRSRAVSENPKAADVAGINVFSVRYVAVIISGAFSGLAGAYLVGDVGSFSEGMTNGRGFIALAAVIFGKWRPFQAMLGALLFGFFDALQSQLQISGVNAPVPILLMIPYLATIVVLAGFIGRAVAPAADGIPYVKE